MKFPALLCAAFAIIIGAAAEADGPAKTPAILLTGGHVLDGDGERWLEGAAVLVQDGHIAAIGNASAMDIPSDATRIDLGGKSLIPGLIDMHTHLLLHPYDEASWNDQVLKESLELRTIRAAVAARKTLEAGFTTIRDLGTEGAAYADVAVRDAVATGMIPGPTVIPVTRAIVATSCYGVSGFDPRWHMPKGAQEATGADEARKVVREQIAAGAEWIKVYADYGRTADADVTPTFSVEELKAMVDEATSAGLPVSAHATSSAGILRAVEAGVRSIEHGYHADEKALRAMKQNNVILCPTLAANEAMSIYAGWTPGEPDTQEIQDVKETFKRALDTGVVIGCGSDAGVFSHGNNAHEIELMVDYGMSPTKALQAATSVAATYLHRGDDLGRIARGYTADLVVVDGDPLKDPTSLRNVVLVIKDGRIAADRRGE